MVFGILPPQHLLESFFVLSDDNKDGLLNKEEYDVFMCKLSTLRQRSSFSIASEVGESKERDFILWNLDKLGKPTLLTA
jgi:hypothetical protein